MEEAPIAIRSGLPAPKRSLPTCSVFRQTAYVTARFQSMKYRVNYLDKPSDQAIIIEAAKPRAAAQQFFSQNARKERCRIRVVQIEGLPRYSEWDFDAVQFMDESARAFLPQVPPPPPFPRVPPPPPLVTGGRLFLCPDCGTPVSKKAASCPKCGRVFRSAQQTGLFNWFIHGYLNDILAGILILAYANLIIGLTPLFDRVIVSPSQIAIFITAAGCYWEFITPLYRQHTADAYNLVAYGFGAALYYAIIRVLPSMHLTNQ